jgi:hypothetical protein
MSKKDIRKKFKNSYVFKNDKLYRVDNWLKIYENKNNKKKT